MRPASRCGAASAPQDGARSGASPASARQPRRPGPTAVARGATRIGGASRRDAAVPWRHGRWITGPSRQAHLLGSSAMSRTSRPPPCRSIGVTTAAGEAILQIPAGGTLAPSNPRAPPAATTSTLIVPIGMKLGSFLLFTEAEIGTILTDNVLDTDFDAHTDIPEVAPEVRLEFELGAPLLLASVHCRPKLVPRLLRRGDQDLPSPSQGPPRRDVAAPILSSKIEKSQTQVGRDLEVASPIFRRPIQTDLHEQHHGGRRPHLQPADAKADRDGRRLQLR